MYADLLFIDCLSANFERPAQQILLRFASNTVELQLSCTITFKGDILFQNLVQSRIH